MDKYIRHMTYEGTEEKNDESNFVLGNVNSLTVATHRKWIFQNSLLLGFSLASIPMPSSI